MTEPQIDYDGAWKEALEEYFEEFIEFFFPYAYNDIDWNNNKEFLDSELQQITQDSETGERFVDKLVKIYRKDNQEAWVLIHIEIQSQPDADFGRRMYVYNYRIFDKFNRNVASFAVLGDERNNWRPSSFNYELWRCKVGFEFPTVKLMDYREQWSELEESDNPFAMVVMAHLKAQETRGDDEERKLWKFILIRRLYEHGYEQEDIVKLLKFIDWLLQLPKELEDELMQNLRNYEEVKHMPYVTSFERIGIEKGIEKGIEQGLKQGLLMGIESVLEIKFGKDGLNLLPEISKIKDVNLLKAINTRLKTASNLDELRHIYQ